MHQAAPRIPPRPDSTAQVGPPKLHLYHPPHTQLHLHHHASPSLRRRQAGGPRAFELKFLLSPQQAAEVEARLAGSLTLDPHADPAEAGGYRVSTLYCDTPRWDVFHRQGRYRFFKLRLRRYGQSELVFLERKSKRKDRVRKLRSSIAIEQLPQFSQSAKLLDGYVAWYHRQLRRNALHPACLVEYRRTAYFGADADGPIRLTFDRQVSGGLTDAWSFDLLQHREQVLTDHVVCEFKFRGPLPAMFKSAIAALQLSPGRVSKYRLCVQALGAAGNGSGADA